MIDGDSPAARLCAAGMAVDGDPIAAHALFLHAWQAHRDAYEASIAAHFLARHQSSPADSLRWNLVALKRAEAVPDGRANPLLPSLYLNLADNYIALHCPGEARAAIERGVAALAFLPLDGYRAFVSNGLHRLLARIPSGDPPTADI